MQETIENTSKPFNLIKKVTSIDFNCDLAQSFGVYTNEGEFDLLDYVSSVNISAGFHAGDPNAIKNALLKAKDKNIVIGAHIGFNDIQGFGQRVINLSEEETETIVIYQVGALMSFAKAYGLEIEHVRPHGGMYKLASQNFSFACAIAKAVKKCSKWLTYVGAAGDVLTKTGDFVKLPVAGEFKISSAYNTDGTIDYNSNEISSYDSLTKRLQRYIQTSQVDNNANGYTIVQANTIHFTSDKCDDKNSLELIKKANELITPTPVNYSKVQSSGWV